MDTATQDAALLALGSGRLSLNPDNDEVEHDPASWADMDELMNEMDLDEDDHPEDDEEEVDAEVALAALIEDRPVIGVRGSARLQASAAQRLDNDIARIMQDCILDDHILMRERSMSIATV